MKTDELCLMAVKQKWVTVNFLTGEVTSMRWHGKKMGCLNTKGYLVINLRSGTTRKQVKVHRLVWIAKNGIPPKGTVLDHINRKKSDNRLCNLRLVDAAGNSQNRRSYKGSANPAAKINDKIVESIRKQYESRDKSKYHHSKSYRKLAKKFNISPSLVAGIIKKEIWQPA